MASKAVDRFGPLRTFGPKRLNIALHRLSFLKKTFGLKFTNPRHAYEKPLLLKIGPALTKPQNDGKRLFRAC